MNLLEEAVDGLAEYSGCLKDPSVRALIDLLVAVPDTGNTQSDYEMVRSEVERIVDNYNLNGCWDDPEELPALRAHALEVFSTVQSLSLRLS